MTKCPACSEPVVGSGRGRPPTWCSGKCRRWVSQLGGPRSAADWKRSWAAVWRAGGKSMHPDAFKIAKQLGAEAVALDALEPPDTVSAGSPTEGATHD